MSHHLGANDFIFYRDKEGDIIYTGGFNVNSILMKQGISPIMTLNKPNQSGGSVSDIFNNLAVPNWALSYNKQQGGNKDGRRMDDEEDTEVISDDLHDKLLNMIKVENIKSKKGKPKTHKNKLLIRASSSNSNKKSKKAAN